MREQARRYHLGCFPVLYLVCAECTHRVYAPSVPTEFWEDDGLAAFDSLLHRCLKEAVQG